MAEKAATKIIRKRWVPILAPKLFHERVIGESYVVEPAQLKGRSVFVNMMTLTGDSRKQNINVQFLIQDVKEGKGHATFSGYRYSPNSIKRLVRRGRDKVDDSFLCKTQDNVVLRIKPVIVTNAKTSRSVQAALRRTFRRKFKEIVMRQSFEQVMRDVLEYKLQSVIKETMHKIAPLKVADVRMLKIEPMEYTETESLTIDLPKKEEEELLEEPAEEVREESKEESSMEEADEPAPKKAKKKKASEDV